MKKEVKKYIEFAFKNWFHSLFLLFHNVYRAIQDCIYFVITNYAIIREEEKKKRKKKKKKKEEVLQHFFIITLVLLFFNSDEISSCKILTLLNN